MVPELTALYQTILRNVYFNTHSIAYQGPSDQSTSTKFIMSRNFQAWFLFSNAFNYHISQQSGTNRLLFCWSATVGRRKGSGNVTGLKFESCTHNRSRSYITHTVLLSKLRSLFVQLQNICFHYYYFLATAIKVALQ